MVPFLKWFKLNIKILSLSCILAALLETSYFIKHGKQNTLSQTK